MQIRKASLALAMGRAQAVNPTLFRRFVQSANVGTILECWAWTLSPDRDGYGILKSDGKNMRAHRVVHDLFHPAAGANLVRHVCNNPLCVNPAHLRAGTPADNAADRVVTGRGGNLSGANNGRAKLTDSEVLEIRSSDLSGAELARMFGISKVMACRIKRGDAWTHI